MAHDPNGKQARLHRIARIRSVKTVDDAAIAYAADLSTHPHFESKDARREVMLIEKYEKNLQAEWHDDAWL